MPPSPERQLFLKEAARRALLNFCQAVSREYVVSWHHEVIAKALEKALETITTGGKARIILAIPPRHGKTRTAAELFPAWALGKYPQLKFILSTYGADLSETTGMKTRDIIDSEAYQFIFPGISLRPDVKSKAKWMTNKNGSYTAVGIGGAITGTGGDVIILDDPHKDRAEAESQTSRNTVWEYYRSTLYSRLEGYGAVIIIMQRWHTDDLVGKLLEWSAEKKKAGESYDEWEVINFPAIAEEDEIIDGELKRKKGQALWESKYPLDILQNIKETAGIYNWVSQYQQQPIASETQVFKEEMFRYFNDEDLDRKNLKYYTLVDPAISEKKTADNTVVLTVAKEITGPNIYRIREDTGHFTPKETIDLVFKHTGEYHSDLWIETVAFQKALKYSIEEEQRNRHVFFLIREVKNGNKETRIRGLLPLYERGVVFHRKTDTEFETEAMTFPKGKHDDRIDCMSFILEAMDNTRNGRTAKQFYPHLLRLGKK